MAPVAGWSRASSAGGGRRAVEGGLQGGLKYLVVNADYDTVCPGGRSTSALRLSSTQTACEGPLALRGGGLSAGPFVKVG